LSSGAASGEKSPDSDIEIPMTSGGFDDEAPTGPARKRLPHAMTNVAAPEQIRRWVMCDRLIVVTPFAERADCPPAFVTRAAAVLRRQPVMIK
jgi:hypothetical protein